MRRRSKPFLRRDSRSGTFRYLAAFVASLCLFAQFSSFAHMLLVRHATCPEHGELIHPDEGGHGTADVHHERVATSEKSQGPSVEASAEAMQGHGHDHCAVLADRRDNIAIATPACPIPVAPPALAVIHAWRNPPTPASFALYLLAPKTSPPA